MNRDVPFDEKAECDICGKDGAFDFMGDYLCEKCASPNRGQSNPNGGQMKKYKLRVGMEDRAVTEGWLRELQQAVNEERDVMPLSYTRALDALISHFILNAESEECLVDRETLACLPVSRKKQDRLDHAIYELDKAWSNVKSALEDMG